MADKSASSVSGRSNYAAITSRTTSPFHPATEATKSSTGPRNSRLSGSIDEGLVVPTESAFRFTERVQ